MRKIIITLVILFSLSPPLLSQDYVIQRHVISSGGGRLSNADSDINCVVGQPLVGKRSSDGYCMGIGYTTGIGCIPPSCYEYLPGDVNMALGAWPPMVIGSDVTYLVNYFRGIETSQPCLMYNSSAIIAPECLWASADVNGDCLVIGSDVTKLVNYFRGLTELDWCSEYGPCWLSPDDLPPEAPPGWPNCVDPCPPEPAAESDIEHTRFVK